ncbi:MAG TPA: crossover junction endodeoxyribonuclease RuvC [Bacteroidota bacterium]|jgi:crossover junction endodeoxyribonuclease RuvC
MGERQRDVSRRRTTNDHSSIIVLGVDPGTIVTGYGIVERKGSTLKLMSSGVIRNSPDSSMPVRLKRIYCELQSLITTFHPDEFAIESAFYGKNPQSALKLGHARGVSILAAVEQEIPTSEYSPREVKKAVVGKGTASKDAVKFMVQSMLGARNSVMALDSSDALAVAICHLHRLVTPASKHRDWKSFVQAHPERVRS